MKTRGLWIEIWLKDLKKEMSDLKQQRRNIKRKNQIMSLQVVRKSRKSIRRRK